MLVSRKPSVLLLPQGRPRNHTCWRNHGLPYSALSLSLGFGAGLVGFNPVGDSRYNGLAVQMTKRYSKNFSYQLAYTYSHAQDDSTATLFSTYFTPRRGQDFAE